MAFQSIIIIIFSVLQPSHFDAELRELIEAESTNDFRGVSIYGLGCVNVFMSWPLKRLFFCPHQTGSDAVEAFISNRYRRARAAWEGL